MWTSPRPKFRALHHMWGLGKNLRGWLLVGYFQIFQVLMLVVAVFLKVTAALSGGAFSLVDLSPCTSYSWRTLGVAVLSISPSIVWLVEEALVVSFQEG